MNLFKSALLFWLLIFYSCSSSLEEKWRSEAYSAFSDYELWEDAKFMNAIDFEGPTVRNQIEAFDIDTSVVIYAWYYKHQKDTFWVYCKVDKMLKKETTIHVSSNYDVLTKGWEEFSKKK